MQDNNPQEFDEQFIGQAWLEMKQLLDQEMPVRQKRRAAWWLWLLAGLLLLVALGGGAFYFYERAHTAPAPATASPTAYLDPPTDAPARPGSQPEPAGGKAEQAYETAGGAVHRPPTAIAPKASGIQALPSKNRAASKREAQAKRPRATNAGKAGASTVAETGKVTLSPAAEPAPPNVAALFPLAKRTAIPLSVTAKQPATDALAINAAHQRGGILKVAVEGSAFFQGRFPLDGFGAGFSLEAHPRNSRMYLRTGAFFRSYHPQATTTGTTVRLENSFSKIPQPDGSIANSNSKLYSDFTVEAARYLQAPLLAGFRCSPRIALEAGVQGGFLLSGATTRRWSLSNQTNNPGSGTPEDNTIYEFREDTDKGGLRAFSLDVVAGLAYRPGRRASLRVSYQYGLLNILDNNRDEAFLRGLQVSLGYYLVD